MSSEIEFSAVVYKVQTLVDGGIRVTFDLTDTGIAPAAMLMECKRQCIALRLKATADERDGVDKLLQVDKVS